MSYTMYTPLNVWLDPASVTDVVAYIQTYLSENTIYSETEIEAIIHDYLIAHPELIGGVQSVNGKTGAVVLSASDINTANNVTIESVLASLSSQISSIAASVATNTTNITSLTGRMTTAETDLTNLKSNLNDVIDINSNIVAGLTLINGGYADATGSFNPDRTDYIAFGELINVENLDRIYIKYIGTTSLVFHFVFFDSNRTRISNVNTNTLQSNVLAKILIPSSCSYISLCATYAYGYSISPSNYSIYLFSNYTNTINKTISSNAATNGFYNTSDMIWTNYIYYFNNGIRSIANNRISLLNTIKLDRDAIIKTDSGHSIGLAGFSTEDPSPSTQIVGVTPWVNSAYLKADVYYQINLRKSDDSALNANDFENDKLRIEYIFDSTTQDYYLDSGFNKKEIALIEQGTVSGYQSFVKYNNKYYVMGQNNIYVYTNAFVLENTVSVSVGHGNSMQLGKRYPNYAYISGWSDNKVYVVDLDTVTVVNTITLPIIDERTTVAVDDVNGLFYVFAASASITENGGYYKFVTYDYNNSSIVSTKYITEPIKAMQACDFVDGVIVALNGLGDGSNGYRIYNTSGDIVGKYIVDSFSTREPEGVFVDRNTNDVYMLFINGRIYKMVCIE